MKKNKKLNSAKQELIDGHKPGMEYNTGVAIAAAKKRTYLVQLMEIQRKHQKTI